MSTLFWVLGTAVLLLSEVARKLADSACDQSTRQHSEKGRYCFSSSEDSLDVGGCPDKSWRLQCRYTEDTALGFALLRNVFRLKWDDH